MNNPLKLLVGKYNPSTSVDHQNALKEVIQEITLAGLSRASFFDKAAFYGGTALRIFYGLPRFSEDLDFTLLKPQKDFSLKPYFKSIEDMLYSFGLSVEVTEIKKSRDRNIESAFLKTNTLIHLLKIVPQDYKNLGVQKNQNIQVKFEVDVTSPQGFETEVKALFPPITSSVKILKPSSLFAGKMHAVLCRKLQGRVKGRDFYDLLWYIGQKIPLKISYLETKMKESHDLDINQMLTESQIIKRLEDKLKTVNWVVCKNDIINFIKDPAELDAWNTDFFLASVKLIKFE